MRLVFLAVTMVVGNLAWAAASESAIEVTGTGTVTFVPDVASITISITARDRDAKVAQSTANSAVAAALKVIDDLGIESRDVTATVMRMHPVYRRARSPGDLQTIEAFESQRSITVRVRELERLGDVVNGALDGGINGIQQIQLDTSERAALEQQALDLAVDHAKREAQQVAERFGVGLGKLVRVNVGQAAQPMFGQVSMAMAREDFAFRPGELTISRQVQAAFAIGD